MITCYLRYVVDPEKLDEFEIYAKKWIPLVNRFGEVIMAISCHMKALTTSHMRYSAFLV